MNTDNIKTIFADYLTAEKTQYAILINGTWGSGKTYFWKYDLNKISEDKGFKTIYVSLNGISKIEALEHQLFLKMIPFIGNKDNKRLQAATSLVTNIANSVSKALFKSTLTDIFKDVSVDTFDFSKYVICFDDLERCQIKIKEVLGFINNYVEHKNLKTIILSDEKNIDKSQTDYDNIKEKVVGRILNFDLNIEETLPLLFKKYETDKTDFYNFLLKNKQVFVDILIEYKQNNLRTISFYLGVLEKVFPALKNVDEKYIQEIILFVAIITIEFKKGSLKSDDYKDTKNLETTVGDYFSISVNKRMRNNTEKVEGERTKSYSETFYEDYLNNRSKDYFFYSSIYSYILSGFLNLTDLETEIKKRYPEVVSPEIEDFRALFNEQFRGLSNSDFNKLTKSVLAFAKEGKYTIYDYVQIANFYYFFSQNKLITETKENILSIIIEGLEISKSKKEINDRVLDNLLRSGDNDPEVTKIKNKVKEIHLAIKKEKNIKEGVDFLDLLINNVDYSALAEVFQKYECSTELFQYVDETLFFDTVIKLSNKQLDAFTELLTGRYHSINSGEFYFEDFECLTKLKDNINNHLTRTTNIEQPTKFLYETLVEKLKIACKHLEDTKKK